MIEKARDRWYASQDRQRVGQHCPGSQMWQV